MRRRKTTHPVKRHLNRAPALGAAALLGVLTMIGAGCALGQLVGGMARSYQENSTRTVQAEYRGLEGKSFAVVVAADRNIQAENPFIVPLLTREISKRLADESGASGWVPPEAVLQFQYQRPSWVTMSPHRLAEEFGVDRLVFVDLTEFALHAPGNPHLWDGVAAGVVGVIETDALLPSDFVYRKPIRVTFPDQQGFTPSQIPAETMQLALVKRFVDRGTWLFYTHEEAYRPKY